MKVYLQFAGLLYLGLLAAGIIMPRVVDLKTHLRTLPVFIRRLFWVYYGFIGISLISFGLLSFIFAEELASGTPLARAVCGFLCLFWSLRFLVAVFVFDVRLYLKGFGLRLGYQATNIVFTVLPFLYGVVAFNGGIV
ncbi:hypothetical protein P0Y35_05740 [Kiritimatiellaeota bacterium B1221]|nr:hypothetical protein [Kiritimatiellaeota bacterium B1221]